MWGESCNRIQTEIQVPAADLTEQNKLCVCLRYGGYKPLRSFFVLFSQL